MTVNHYQQHNGYDSRTSKRRTNYYLFKNKKLAKQKEARFRLEKPKRPLKFLQFYVGRDKNRKQHVGGCKGKNRVSDHRAYCRKFIKPTINKIAA